MEAELKKIMIKCIGCGSVWKKHFKKIERNGKLQWIQSKEMHYCLPKPKLEETRKDWQ